MKVHTGEKPHECSVCKKRFRQLVHLKTHMRSHTGEKPYKCSICKKGFTNSSAVKTHMMMHTGEKPLQCTVCKERFRYSSTLKQHMAAHTGHKAHKCSKCTKCFSAASDLIKHLMTHTAAKTCKNSRQRRTVVKSSTDEKYEGMKTRSGRRSECVSECTEQQYTHCETCIRGFQQQFELQNHLRMHMLAQDNHPTMAWTWCVDITSELDEYAEYTQIQPRQVCYQCKRCVKGFLGVADLEYHVATHHILS